MFLLLINLKCRILNISISQIKSFIKVKLIKAKFIFLLIVFFKKCTNFQIFMCVNIR